MPKLTLPPPPAAASGRRDFLRRVSVGLGALPFLPLVGCFPRAEGSDAGAGDTGVGGTGGTGGGGGGTGGPSADEQEAGLFVAEYQMEHYAIFAYGAARDALDAGPKAMGDLFRSHHVGHLDAAGEALKRLGFPEPEVPASYDVAMPDNQTDILRLALQLESLAVGAWLSLVGQHLEPAHRILAASVLGCETSHVVALLQALGDTEALGAAFAGDLPAHVKAFLE